MSDALRRTNSASAGDAGTSLLLGAAGLVTGAALMYFFDPELGEGRRNQLADRLGGMARRAGRGVGGWTEDVTQELQAVPHEFRYRSSDEPVSDDVLASRVRSELGHMVRHAGAIDVQVTDGRVVLSGPVLADETVGVLATIHTSPGVKEVDDDPLIDDRTDSICEIATAWSSEHRNLDRLSEAIMGYAEDEGLSASIFPRPEGELSEGIVAVTFTAG